MLSSINAFHFIDKQEKNVLTAYPDPASELGEACTKLGLPMTEYTHVPRWQLLNPSPVSIGRGYTGGTYKLGDAITPEKSDELFRLGIKHAEYRLMGLEGLNQNQFDALVSLAYNCPAALAHGTTLRKHLEAREWDHAADEMLRWHYAKGKPLAGLMTRRAAERELFLTPVAG